MDRVSLFYFGGMWMLYNKANCAERGHRQLQVLALRLMHWVQFASAGLPVDATTYLGHVYQTHGKTLVAIMHIALRSNKGQPSLGGVYIAESCCGLELGQPGILKTSDA